MDKDEIKKFVEDAFAGEMKNRQRALNAWYQPPGAPGRLSEELLEVWHKKHETGITHPSDMPSHCVTVSYEAGQICRCFGARWDAISFRDKMLDADLDAVYANPYTREEDIPACLMSRNGEVDDVKQ